MIVSTTLIRVDEDDTQRSVYFMSKMLTYAETRYTDFRRIALALRMEAKKLRSYFQAYNIIILTSYSIKTILHNPDASRWLLKWTIELSKFDVVYRSRSTIKGQVLIDFMVEMSDVQPHDVNETLWILETNGLSKVVGGGAGMVL